MVPENVADLVRTKTYINQTSKGPEIDTEIRRDPRRSFLINHGAPRDLWWAIPHGPDPNTFLVCNS